MEKTWASKPMSFWVIKGKDGIWTRAWRRSTCRISSPVPYQTGPPFQDAEKGIWTLTPEGAHAPEACVSAVPPPPHSSIILFLIEMPRKNSILSTKCMEATEKGWDKSPSLSIVFGLSSKTQWLSGLYYADFISFYSPTQLCGGGTMKSNSNEWPISVPLSFFYLFITHLRIKFFLFCRGIFEKENGP